MSSNNVRLTNEIVDKRLIDDNKPIKRVGDYTNAHIKIEWRCNKCDHIWSAIPNSILKSKPSGCPACAGKIKYTNNDIDYKLKDRDLIRVGNYINYDTPIKWKCTKCKHEWKASPNGVLSKPSNCPICSRIAYGKRRGLANKARTLEILKTKSIVLIGEYKKITLHYDFKCVKCDHVWNTSLNNIVNQGSGCPNCVGLVKLTNETVDEKLLLRDDIIYRIDDIINARTKCTWQCGSGHKWLSIPDSVLNHGTGCPTCNAGFYSRGYIQTNPEVMASIAKIYFVEFTQKATNVSFVKIGITKHTIHQRFHLYKKKYNIETLSTKQQTLLDCINLERDIIYKMKKFQYIPEGNFSGKTECFIDTPEVKESILKLLE